MTILYLYRVVLSGPNIYKHTKYFKENLSDQIIASGGKFGQNHFEIYYLISGVDENAFLRRLKKACSAENIEQHTITKAEISSVDFKK